MAMVSKVKESRMNTVLPFGVLSGLATWSFNAVQHDAISYQLMGLYHCTAWSSILLNFAWLLPSLWKMIHAYPCTHPCGMGRTWVGGGEIETYAMFLLNSASFFKDITAMKPSRIHRSSWQPASCVPWNGMVVPPLKRYCYIMIYPLTGIPNVPWHHNTLSGGSIQCSIMIFQYFPI